MNTTLLRLLSAFVPRLRAAAAGAGVVRRVSNHAAKTTFDWTPRPTDQTFLDTARSLLALDRLTAEMRTAVRSGTSLSAPIA
jgi:hypothetical protein